MRILFFNTQNDKIQQIRNLSSPIVLDLFTLTEAMPYTLTNMASLRVCESTSQTSHCRLNFGSLFCASAFVKHFEFS